MPTVELSAFRPDSDESVRLRSSGTQTAQKFEEETRRGEGTE